MADKNQRKITVPQGGMFRDVMLKVKLILRLMGDPQVSIFLKLLPLAGVAYWLLPLPLDSLIPVVDDAAIVWLGSYIFIELCPPTVVEKHMKALRSNMDIVDGNDDVIDAESTDVN